MQRMWFTTIADFETWPDTANVKKSSTKRTIASTNTWVRIVWLVSLLKLVRRAKSMMDITDTQKRLISP